MKRTTDPTQIDFKKKFDLTGKVIIITGGQGLIGRAFCEGVAQFGAHIVIADIPAANSEEAAKALEDRHHRTMLGFSLDVASREEVNDLLQACIDKFGKVDGLVNSHQNKTKSFFLPFEEYQDDMWDAVIETNLKGTFLTCQIIGGWMAMNKKGNIVNIPSTYSVVAPNQNLYEGTSMGCPAAYSASKGGVEALSNYLSSYWADKGVRVNMLTPHGVWNNHENKFEENFSRFSPLKRMSYNHETVGALIFLLSDASSYTVGNNVLVEGGWTVW